MKLRNPFLWFVSCYEPYFDFSPRIVATQFVTFLMVLLFIFNCVACVLKRGYYSVLFFFPPSSICKNGAFSVGSFNSLVLSIGGYFNSSAV